MTRWKIAILCLVMLLFTAACTEQGDNKESVGQSKSSQTALNDGKCEHDLSQALCTKCNPALAAVLQAKGDWCDEHGFPESFCPVCKPDAQGPAVAVASGSASDWCVQHAIPESKCTKCNLSLVSQFKKSKDWCAEHGFPESVCPVCHPVKPPPGVVRAAIEGKTVRLQSPDMEDSTGIKTVQAEEAPNSPFVSVAARIAFDSDRVGDIRAVVPGIVRRIRVGLGVEVKRGAPLFVLESTRVGEIQGALQAAQERVRVAQSNLDRYTELLAKDFTTASDVEIAQKELASALAEKRAAKAVLRIAGAAESTPTGRYFLTAPIKGTVVRRPAVVGMLATENDSLATIADTTVVWAMCDVPEADASRIALGQKVLVITNNGTKQAGEGKITWIASEVDPRTRTVTARAEIDNSAGRLRANQFATAKIFIKSKLAGVTIPRAAVQRVSDMEVVFVRTNRGVYEPRVIQRHGDGDLILVEGRLKAGDAVVTTGAVLLRTEIMPGSIGAGCCEVGPPGGI